MKTSSPVYVFLVFFLVLTAFSPHAFSGLTSRLGFTTGSMQRTNQNANNFTELDVGLRYAFDETFSIQGSFLTRFVENDEKYYGGQLMAPVTLEIGNTQFSVQSYLAPGYRVIGNFHAPMIEGGVGLKLDIFRLGLGYRLAFNGLVKNGLEDEAQLFIFTTIGVF